VWPRSRAGFAQLRTWACESAGGFVGWMRGLGDFGATEANQAEFALSGTRQMIEDLVPRGARHHVSHAIRERSFCDTPGILD
jgi:hypothetical protein